MPDNPPEHLGGPPQALLDGVRRLLGPLVRLLLENRMTYPILTSLLKSVYVEEATQHFSIPEKPQTISRLSLLTGIHRKDVKRLQEEGAKTRSAPPHVSLGAQLVLLWTADPRYRDADDQPMALRRLDGDLGGPSFESLVQSVSKDIRPRAVLDEWLRLGIVTVDADEMVHLASHAFVPEKGFDEKAYFLGRNVGDHLASAAHNISHRGPPMLERNVYYAHLSAESTQELEQLAETEGMQALQRINRRALELQRRDAGSPSSVQRMSFGIYFHRAVSGSSTAETPSVLEESSDTQVDQEPSNGD